MCALASLALCGMYMYTRACVVRYIYVGRTLYVLCWIVTALLGAITNVKIHCRLHECVYTCDVTAAGGHPDGGVGER